MHKTLVSSLRVLMVVIAVLGLFAVSCGSDDGVTTDSTSTTAADTTSTAPTTTEATTTQAPTTEPTTTTTTEPDTTTTTTTTPDPDLEVVRVYWLRDTGIAVGGREVEMSSLPDSAMAALLEGPNTLETELGMVSAIPAGTEVLGLTIEDGVATVDFSSAFETTGMGTTGEIGLVSQVVFTLTQFPTVDAVDITIEGEVRDAILSHGLEATNLTREGFYDAVAPAILVESPYPGQLVTSPLTVTGLSRTFEATVVYDIVIPPSGLIVDDGFITVAQPDMDQFGLFEFTVDFETDVAGFGAVILYEESAEDGSQINIYEVPVMMEPAAG